MAPKRKAAAEKEERYKVVPFKFTEDSEDEESSDEESEQKQEDPDLLKAMLTDKTLNLLEHLGQKLSRIGGEGLTAKDIKDVFTGDGSKEEPDLESSGFRMLGTHDANTYWAVFDESLKKARAALKKKDYSKAFNVCFSVTMNFWQDDHWMRDSEDTAHSVKLVNQLGDLWRQLLPLEDAELDIGPLQTRQVVGGAIKALWEMVDEASTDARDSKGVVTHSYCFDHKNVKLSDYNKLLATGPAAAAAASARPESTSRQQKMTSAYGAPGTGGASKRTKTK